MAFRWLRLRKRVRQYLRYRQASPEALLLVAGCQRSGTSLIHHVLRLDLDTVTFDEISPLSTPDDPKKLRWRALAEVKTLIGAERSPLVVAKPLVESQQLDQLLDLHPHTRALWMFRPFRDVARSNIKYFGRDNGHADLAPLLAGDTTDWRVQSMAAEDLQAVKELYRPNLSAFDAAALFWFARNSLFFSRGFDREPRIRLCCYDDLVTRPQEVMRGVYAFIGRDYPGDGILKDVFRDSRGKGKDVVLEDGVSALCQNLLDRLLASPRVSGPSA